jgi:hypothetical protein
LEVAEDAPLLIVHRLGGDGSHLVPDICLKEGATPDALVLDLLVCFPQRVLTLHAAHDEMRVFERLGDEKACGFGNGVTGLD